MCVSQCVCIYMVDDIHEGHVYYMCRMKRYPRCLWKCTYQMIAHPSLLATSSSVK
jgi:hypothetical protein